MIGNFPCQALAIADYKGIQKSGQFGLRGL
jgi:hypothetical protein